MPYKPPTITRSFPCTHCRKAFTRKFHLQRHLLTHPDSTASSTGRPFTCPLCLSSFTRRDVLNRHVEAHARREQQLDDDEAQQHVERQTPSRPQTRTPRRAARTFAACDACTLQKIRCDDGAPCRACERMGMECTFERPQRAKGRYRASATASPATTSGDGLLYGSFMKE